MGSPDLWVVGHKECTDEISSNSTDDIEDGRPEPSHTLLNMTENEE